MYLHFKFKKISLSQCNLTHGIYNVFGICMMLVTGIVQSLNKKTGSSKVTSLHSVNWEIINHHFPQVNIFSFTLLQRLQLENSIRGRTFKH